MGSNVSTYPNQQNGSNSYTAASISNIFIRHFEQQQMAFTSKQKATFSSEQITEIKYSYFDVFLDLNQIGLGISIRGGIDSPHPKTGLNEIFISKILKAGAVYKDGRLKIGDVITHVNSTSLIGVTHRDAVDAIVNAGPYLHFKVKRRVFDDDSNNIYEQVFDEDAPLLLERDYESEFLEELLNDDNTDNSNNHFKTYENCIKVLLTRDANGFGFSVRGGINNNDNPSDTGLYIQNIIQNGQAHKSGQMEIGDEIVAINNINLEKVPFDWALDAIKKSSSTSIFTIRKTLCWN